MTTKSPRETSLWIKETVLLVNVKLLIVVNTFLFIELVVDTVCLVLNIAILQVAKHIPMLINVIGCLNECVAIELGSVRVVVFVVAIRHIFLAYVLIGDVCKIAKVVTVELLKRETSDYIPKLVFVIGVPDKAVGVLRQTFFAYKVGLFYAIIVKSELLEFVVEAELVVVTITIGVMQRCSGAPMLVDIINGREDVVVLPEVIGSLAPIAAVGHLIA